ncbi:MAG: DUF6544 family protein [Synechococcus sp.]
MGLKIIVLVAIALSFLIAPAILYGKFRWEADARIRRRNLEAARLPIAPKTYNPQELEGLPTPVQRYFRTVLQVNQPAIAAVSIEHQGTINLSETGEQWLSFASTQRIIIHPPGFDWNARIKISRSIPVYVHDSYIACEGSLDAVLFGLILLVNLRETLDLARGQLMSFLCRSSMVSNCTVTKPGCSLGRG